MFSSGIFLLSTCMMQFFQELNKHLSSRAEMVPFATVGSGAVAQALQFSPQLWPSPVRAGMSVFSARPAPQHFPATHHCLDRQVLFCAPTQANLNRGFWLEPVHQYSSSSCRERFLHSLLCLQQRPWKGLVLQPYKWLKNSQILSISLYDSYPVY